LYRKKLNQYSKFTWTLAQPALALHTQFFNTDLYADVIAAVLLIVACMDEHLDLAKIGSNIPLKLVL